MISNIINIYKPINNLLQSIKLVLQFCNIKYLTLLPIYLVWARFSDWKQL